jgi:hypothetical protein
MAQRRRAQVRVVSYFKGVRGRLAWAVDQEEEPPRMQTDNSRVYVMPTVKEKPPLPVDSPRTQRELVMASLLARPSSEPTNKK